MFIFVQPSQNLAFCALFRSGGAGLVASLLTVALFSAFLFRRLRLSAVLYELRLCARKQSPVIFPPSATCNVPWKTLKWGILLSLPLCGTQNSCNHIPYGWYVTISLAHMTQAYGRQFGSPTARCAQGTGHVRAHYNLAA